MFNFFRKLGAIFGREDLGNYDSLFEDVKVGALYSIYNGDESRTFGVVKIVAIDRPEVFIIVYNESFEDRPNKVDPERLTRGIEEEIFKQAIDEDKIEEMFAQHGLGFEIPVHIRDFIYGWQPVYLMESPVTEDELEGYRSWQEDS